MKNTSILGWHHTLGRCAVVAALAAGLLVTAEGAVAQGAPVANLEAGKKRIDMCIGCHGIPGYQATFPEIHHVPKISGQSASYITAALKAYRSGERKHPTMRSIAGSLSDQDIANVAAAYEDSGKPFEALPDEAAAGNQEATDLIAKAGCTGCHGKNFSTPASDGMPKIAGQYPDYLYVALKAYQTEGNPLIGRGNAIMSAMAKQFTHEQLHALATYIAGLPGVLKTVPQDKFRHPQP